MSKDTYMILGTIWAVGSMLHQSTVFAALMLVMGLVCIVISLRKDAK